MEKIDAKRRRSAALLLSLPWFAGGARAQVRAAGTVPDTAADTAADPGLAIAGPAAAFMDDPRAVGLSVGVLHAGQARSRHFGTAGKRHGRRADDRTIYPIASLTKTFTGLLLARAQADGKLALDDDIRKHLDGDYPNLAFEGQPIRIHHLVNHVSGLPRLLPDRPEARPDFPSDIPYPQRLRALVAGSSRAGLYAGLQRVTLDAPPGSRFQYSNAAAQLAGDILERRYGSSFEALVRRHVAAPLGMRDTRIVPTPAQRQRLVQGYDEAGTPQLYFPIQAGAAGALKSTLADMLAYARWQLAGRDPAVRLSHRPTDRAGDYTAGLNWQIQESGGRRVLFQDGSHPGFACLLVLYPDSDAAIVALVNEIDGGTMERLRTLANGIARGLDAGAPVLN
jgi:D-alanyl-D-alanine-carboxypeptidase/D-alanyl-D-alanine-endopeptidase